MGRKRHSNEITGKDMANRCYDATLSFLLQTLPLCHTVQACVSEQLASRWVPITHSSASTITSDGSTSTNVNAYSYAARASAAATAELDTTRSLVSDTENMNSGNVRIAGGNGGLSLQDSQKKKGHQALSEKLGMFFEGVRRNPEDADLAGPGHGCLVAKDFRL
jgi:hypothetical protein